MRIALVGYGKMGQTIERIANEKGFSISYVIDRNNQADISLITPDNTDVAIEFSTPESAYTNLNTLIKNGVKIVCGTTGWLDQFNDIKTTLTKHQGTFLYASNFSIGVNLFFELNEWLATKMNGITKFESSIEEIHHTQKKDAPSGTAITIAEGILNHHNRYKKWSLDEKATQEDLPIHHKRIGEVPGTHSVSYSSPLETIEIKHVAHDRKVFAEGVIEVAQWVTNQKGLLTIKDFIKSLV